MASCERFKIWRYLLIDKNFNYQLMIRRSFFLYIYNIKGMTSKWTQVNYAWYLSKKKSFPLFFLIECFSLKTRYLLLLLLLCFVLCIKETFLLWKLIDTIYKYCIYNPLENKKHVKLKYIRQLNILKDAKTKVSPQF